MLVAAGTGLVDVCKFLIDSGCDMSAVNFDGKGALHKAGGSSTKMARMLREQGCPETVSTVRSKTRKDVSLNRVVRYAQTLSTCGNYTARTRPGTTDEPRKRRAGTAKASESDSSRKRKSRLVQSWPLIGDARLAAN